MAVSNATLSNNREELLLQQLDEIAAKVEAYVDQRLLEDLPPGGAIVVRFDKADERIRTLFTMEERVQFIQKIREIYENEGWRTDPWENLGFVIG